jgi:hypothetical protein
VNLQKLLERVPGAAHKIFKIYNPESNNYIDFQSVGAYHLPYTLPRSLLKLNVLLIKYSEGTHNPDSCDLSSSSDEVKK